AQYHINAAIAWAVRRYVDVCGDEVFLREYGAEMLFETARIWMDIGHFNPRRDGAFCIHEVTGPDEYTVLVDNNHYTNRMAQAHLFDAARTAEWLADTYPDAYAALAERIGLQAEELRQWRHAAEAMYLPVDERLGIFPQDDTFLDKPRLSRQASAKRPLLLHLHPLTIYRHQVCKQADTVLALVLAGGAVDQQAKRRNLEYYEDVTVHDSTLSASTFAVLAAEVGALDKAYKYFLESLRVDLDDLHGNAAHGVHLASMAGSWLALTWGFGGLRVHSGQLQLTPRLPPEWQSYRFGVVWRNTRLRVAVDTAGVTYSLLDGNAIEFNHAGATQHLHSGQTLHFPSLSLSPVESPTQPLQAVIFDLDGVLADTAVLHQAAWQSLATELAIPFAPSQAERMRGLDRRASLAILLEHVKRPYSEIEKQALSDRKNASYQALIKQLGPHNLLPNARAAIEAVRAAGLMVALASASRNAPEIVRKLGIAELFDYIVDAAKIEHSKPAPDIYLDAAKGLGVHPNACLGVEDAVAGLVSIRAAGMSSLGIGDPQILVDADAVLTTLTHFDPIVFMAGQALPARPTQVSAKQRSNDSTDPKVEE
ncbi:MAG TPA: beta-phosphoglucomutase, partial [Mizugakiibacter sp.]|nr:beta-phosphoglucomutase [Mizugakiibacter sp.]